ncbi:MAG: 50S ribosomal protein L6 [Gammaproteobacteria bacterium]|jgi:large subunit ribosomal protein L6
MSRIANAPIPVPSGVEVKIDGGKFRAKGPKGELALDVLEGISVSQDEGNIRVAISAEDAKAGKKLVAMSGTIRALVNNIITGVSTGFEKTLTIIGVGYRAQAQGSKLNLTLGFSHPVEYMLPEGVSAETPNQTTIVLRSADKQLLGQAAAEIRQFRPPEPYKGKGVRYQDEYVLRKQAKKK